MNKTKVDWATHSWNPITGCLHGCEYCYARGIAHRFNGTKAYPKGFEPMFHSDRIDEPSKLKEPSHIFTVSMGDMFGRWVSDHWITQVLIAIEENPMHTFTVLTKNPGRLWEYDKLKAFPQNMIVGTSVTGLMDDAETDRLRSLQDVVNTRKVVSLEPLLHEPSIPLLPLLSEARLDWLIIGGQTGTRVFVPQKEWINELLAWSVIGGKNRRKLPLFIKDNCSYGKICRNYPVGVPHEEATK